LTLDKTRSAYREHLNWPREKGPVTQRRKRKAEKNSDFTKVANSGKKTALDAEGEARLYDADSSAKGNLKAKSPTEAFKVGRVENRKSLSNNEEV